MTFDDTNSALIMSKLYSNSIMMTFNNRSQLRALRGGVQTSTRGRVAWVTTETQVETTVDPTPILRPPGQGGRAHEYSLKSFASASKGEDLDLEVLPKAAIQGAFACGCMDWMDAHCLLWDVIIDV